jgi:hypothetical protein
MTVSFYHLNYVNLSFNRSKIAVNSNSDYKKNDRENLIVSKSVLTKHEDGDHVIQSLDELNASPSPFASLDVNTINRNDLLVELDDDTKKAQRSNAQSFSGIVSYGSSHHNNSAAFHSHTNSYSKIESSSEELEEMIRQNDQILHDRKLLLEKQKQEFLNLEKEILNLQPQSAQLNHDQVVNHTFDKKESNYQHSSHTTNHHSSLIMNENSASKVDKPDSRNHRSEDQIVESIEKMLVTPSHNLTDNTSLGSIRGNLMSLNACPPSSSAYQLALNEFIRFICNDRSRYRIIHTYYHK